MVFPFQFEHPINGRGWLTIAVVVVCVCVYIYQFSDDKAYQHRVTSFCEMQVEGDTKSTLGCMDLVMHFHYSQMDLDEYLKPPDTVANAKDATSALLLRSLGNTDVQPSVTALGAFHPERPLSATIITSVFLHADIWHLFFNLLFFYAFSRTAEELLGPLGYIGLLLGSATAIVWILKSGSFGFPTDRPTIGLSGIVFSVMAFVSTVMPNGMVRVVYWFVVVFGYLRMPAILLVLGYVAINYYDLLSGPPEDVNYLAHIGGAVSGAAFAMVYLGYKFIKNQLRKA